MKNAREILIRILGCIALSARGSCEWTRMPKSERQKDLAIVKQWMEFESEIYEQFTEKEKKLFETRIGSIKRKKVSEFVWYWEATEVLAWTIGLIDGIEIPYYKENTTDVMRVLDEKTGILPLTKGTPYKLIQKFANNHVIDSILAHAHIRDTRIVEEERDRAMIWHWRAMEGKDNIFQQVPFISIIEKTFGDPSVTKIVDSLPIANDGMDLLVGKMKKFYSMSREEIHYAEFLSEWRQKALEWVLNNESWDDTTPDT